MFFNSYRQQFMYSVCVPYQIFHGVAVLIFIEEAGLVLVEHLESIYLTHEYKQHIDV